MSSMDFYMNRLHSVISRVFLPTQLPVVIPRTYYEQLQLKFLSEESSHSPVSAVRYVRVLLSYTASEVQLCHNVQSAVS